MAKKRLRHKWVDWNRQSPADTSIGKVLLLSSIYANTEDGTDYLSGDVVDVAKALTTNAGAQYRVMGTNTWLGEYQVIAMGSVQLSAKQNPDNVVKRTIFANQFIPEQGCGNIKTMESSTARATLTKPSRAVPKPVSSKAKYKTMDKSVLKSTIKALTVGQEINITFIGAKAHLTGDWSVVKTKTGKGKGGSKLMELVNADKETITTGTPESQYILNMTVNDELIGYASEADIPVVFEKNVEQSNLLKTAFLALKGAEGNKTVTIEATVPELTGTFTVNKQTQLRGRGGQIRLDLARVDAPDETVEAWSLRHSGIITSFVVDSDEA